MDPPSVDPHRAQQEQLALVRACLAGNRAAQARFSAEFEDCLYLGVRRIRADAGFVEETVQRLRARLFLGADAKLAAYSGSGPLRAWLQIVAARAALDALRAEARRQHYERVAASDVTLLPAPEVEQSVERSRYGKLFRTALRAALRSLDLKERKLLKLRYATGHELEAIGELQGVHRSTVARWFAAIATRLRRALHGELSQRGAVLSVHEMHSLGHLLRSQLASAVNSWLELSRDVHEALPAANDGRERAQ
jgi:RNA polymerase sigma-70 factor (ECF subfamily)